MPTLQPVVVEASRFPPQMSDRQKEEKSEVEVNEESKLAQGELIRRSPMGNRNTNTNLMLKFKFNSTVIGSSYGYWEEHQFRDQA